MKNITIAFCIMCAVLAFQSAPIEAYLGLIVFAVLVSITWLFILQIAKRSKRRNEYQYFVVSKERKEYPPQNAHSNALDVASDPWVNGDEHDSRSHAYAKKMYYERESAARQMAYDKQVKRDEATRKLNKWKVSES